MPPSLFFRGRGGRVYYFFSSCAHTSWGQPVRPRLVSGLEEREAGATEVATCGREEKAFRKKNVIKKPYLEEKKIVVRFFCN